MADLKISQLTAISVLTPATDVLPVVDVGGVTKKIQVNQILASNGVATLASATITGDLTVSGNGAFTGIGYVALQRPLVPVGENGNTTLDYRWYSTGTTYVTGARVHSSSDAAWSVSSTPARLMFSTVPSGSTTLVERYRIDSTGISTWSVAGTTAMTLNSTGLGVGVTPSAGKFEVLETGTGSGLGGIFASTATAGGNPGFVFRTASTNRWAINLVGSAGVEALRFYDVNASATRMTLDASGNLLVGTTNTSATAGPGFKSQFSLTVPQFAIVVNEAGTSTSLSIYNVSAAAYRFYVNNGGTVFATNTTISAVSDARLKENVQDIDVGLGAILALKPRKFDWKAGKGKDIKGDRGFIAQEFEAVFPNLVDEWKDQAPEGESPYKSVRQDLIPVLVKAIQELTARVQTLEAR